MLKEYVTAYAYSYTDNVEDAIDGLRGFLDADMYKGALITWLHSEPFNESTVTHYFSVFVESFGDTRYIVENFDKWLLNERLGKKVGSASKWDEGHAAILLKMNEIEVILNNISPDVNTGG